MIEHNVSFKYSLSLDTFASRCLWRPLVFSPQTSSEALWSSIQTLLRTTCTQKTQASTAFPATITKQNPACHPRTCKALPPPKQLTVSAPTSAPTTTALETDSSRNTTERVLNRGRDPTPLLVRGYVGGLRVVFTCLNSKGLYFSDHNYKNEVYLTLFYWCP